MLECITCKLKDVLAILMVPYYVWKRSKYVPYSIVVSNEWVDNNRKRLEEISAKVDYWHVDYRQDGPGKGMFTFSFSIDPKDENFFRFLP